MKEQLDFVFDTFVWQGLNGAEPFGGSRKGGPELGPFFCETNLELGVSEKGVVVSVATSDGEVIIGIDGGDPDEPISGTLPLGRRIGPAAAKAIAARLVRPGATRAELEALGFEFVSG